MKLRAFNPRKVETSSAEFIQSGYRSPSLFFHHSWVQSRHQTHTQTYIFFLYICIHKVKGRLLPKMTTAAAKTETACYLVEV